MPEKDRPDPTPRILHPVTGELVPDPEAKLAYMEPINPRPAEWPRADFIVGNPPYLGEKRQRDALGDGYVDALRAAFGDRVSSSADLVLYWWVMAAERVAARSALRAGLITTNSIKQAKNSAHLSTAERAGARVVWAVADHPWVEEQDGAAVRVAMTVTAADQMPARIVEVDDNGAISSVRSVQRLNANLTSGIDVGSTAATPLKSNDAISHQGFKIGGEGFMLTREESRVLIGSDASALEIVRPITNGKDLSSRARGMYVIDFGLQSEDEARSNPRIFDWLRDRVYDDRQSNARESYRRFWWRFLEPRRGLREAIRALPAFIATLEVSKHRFFVRLPAAVAPDGTLVVVALDSAYHLGVLSSSLHVAWTLAAGGTLEDRPRYNKNRCFDAFPFPDTSTALRTRIAAISERLDRHRTDAIARDERVTMTGMYNVVEKLRSGESLTAKERVIHEIAACGVFKDIHDELDAVVAEAYSWPWPLPTAEILERLVTLHDERVEEEKRGLVRWLRPDYQIPRFGAAEQSVELALVDAPVPKEKKPKKNAVSATPQTTEWPNTAVAQISAISALLNLRPQSTAQVVTALTGAKHDLVQRHLDTLALMGEVMQGPDGKYESNTRAG